MSRNTRYWSSSGFSPRMTNGFKGSSFFNRAVAEDRLYRSALAGTVFRQHNRARRGIARNMALASSPNYAGENNDDEHSNGRRGHRR